MGEREGQVRRWLVKAEHDLRTAETMSRVPDPPTDTVSRDRQFGGRKMHKRFLVVVLLVAALGAPLARSGEVRRGEFKIEFTKRSPLSAADVVKRRCGRWSMSVGRYDLSKLTFDVGVPEDYDPATPHGLIFIHCGPLPRKWDPMFFARRIIWMSAKTRSLQAAIDAVHNMKKLYNIDGERVYVSASEEAIVLPICFPDVFKGAAVIIGQTFYRDVWPWIPPNQGRPVTFEPPPQDILDRAKKEGRFALMVGEKDNCLRHVRSVYENGFVQDGFRNVTYIEIPGGRGSVGREWFEKALSFVDAPRPEKAKAAYEEPADLDQKGGYGRASVESLKEKVERETAEAKRALAEGRYFDAFSTLRGVLKRFGEKGAPEAAGLLARIEADPEFPRKLKAAAEKKVRDRHEKAARQSLEIARKIFERDEAKGHEWLRRVAERHPDTAAGREAAGELRRITADPELRARIDGARNARAAERLLGQARNYAANGMNALARKKLQEIVRKFPDTHAARQAEKLLETLGP